MANEILWNSSILTDLEERKHYFYGYVALRKCVVRQLKQHCEELQQIQQLLVARPRLIEGNAWPKERDDVTLCDMFCAVYCF